LPPSANGNPATLAGYRVFTCDAMSLSSTLNSFPIFFSFELKKEHASWGAPKIREKIKRA
jgi:hypothetical protein